MYVLFLLHNIPADAKVNSCCNLQLNAITYTTRINEMREDIPDNLLEPLNTLIEHGVSPRSDIQHNVNNTITNTYQNILVCIG